MWSSDDGLRLSGDCDVIMEYFRLISQYNEDDPFPFLSDPANLHSHPWPRGLIVYCLPSRAGIVGSNPICVCLLFFVVCFIV